MTAITHRENKPNRKRLISRIIIFALGAGPLIGDLPFIWYFYSIPVAYLLGTVPALLGGSLYGYVMARPGTSDHYNWLQRMLIGAVCGAAGALVLGLVFGPPFGPALVLVPFGAGAGAICALIYKRAWMERDLFHTPVTQFEIGDDTVQRGQGEAP